MSFQSEEERIIEKIEKLKTFQTETWVRLDFIFKILADFEFQKKWDFRVHNSRSIGWQYFFIRNQREIARVLASDFLGRYIQVEFAKENISDIDEKILKINQKPE